MKQYYDARAPEYDQWYMGAGRFAELERPDWDRAVGELERAISELPPARTLDVACGTGFLTRHLRGELTALDQSARMVEIARGRVPRATVIEADALSIPFEDGAFERAFTAHFYGHLEPRERAAFLREAGRLASELVVVDSAVRPDHEREERQTRVLNDGSCYEVYKRYFEAAELAAELGGGTVLHESPWFVAVSTRAPRLGY